MKKNKQKGFCDGDVVRANLAPDLAALIRDAAKVHDPVSLAHVLRLVRPGVLEDAAREVRDLNDEVAALAEEEAGL